MDFDISDLISSCQSIISSLPTSSDVEKMDMLQSLAEIFIFAGPDLLSTINLNDSILTILECFKSTEDSEILDLSSTCLVNFIDTFNPRSSIFFSNNAVQVFADKFDTGKLTQSTIGNIIKILKFLVDDEPQSIGLQFGVLRLLQVYDTLRLAEQRSAMHCISSMYGYKVSNEISEYIPKLCTLLNSSDTLIQREAVSALSKIVPAMNSDQYKIEMIPSLQEFVNREENISSLESILKVMMGSSKRVSFAQLIVDSKFNFSRILSPQFATQNKEIPNKVLNLLLNIFPPADLPPDFWDKPHDLANGLKEYSEQVVQYFLPFVQISSGNENLQLALLCVCQKLSPFDYPSEIFTKVSVMLQELNVAPFALLFCLTSNPKYDSLLVKSGIFTQLKDLHPKQAEIQQWYIDNLEVLSKRIGNQFNNIFDGKEFNTIEDLVHFIDTNNFSPYEFEEANIAEKAFDLLKKSPSIAANDGKSLRRLLEICKQMSVNASLPCPADIHSDRDSNSFAQGLLQLQIVLEGEINDNINLRNPSLFVGIEAWYNRDIKKISEGAFKGQNPELDAIIQVEHPDRLSLTEVGLLHRAFKTPGYKRFKYRMKGVTYSYLDSIFQSFVRSLEKPEDYKSVVPVIEMIEETEEEGENDLLISTLSTSEFAVSKTNKLLELIDLIHQKDPTLDFHFTEMEKRLRKQTTFYNTIGRFTPAVKIVPKYPYLFSRDFRLLLYKLTTLDMFTSLSIAHSALFNKSDQLLEGKMHFICKVRRDHIFEDGILLLNKIGPGCVHFDISFDNEPGFGSGPMREFISLMSTEFSKKDRNMWRSNRASDSGIAIGENGYFPSLAANPELFYTLGILCGKSLQIGLPVPISFNTQFFKLIRGEPIDLKMIDYAFYNTLKSTPKEGFFGLPFVYPGCESVELIPNGANVEVNKENVDNYLQLIEMFSVGGPRLEQIKKRFLDGFNKIVLNDSMMKLIDAEEMNSLISGEKVSVTLDDLFENIILEHGYNKSSPEIKMLFETIVEMDDKNRSMFFKFITGSERLPIGGLANLSPKVRVAKRVVELGQKPDDTLPTVSTCSCYFKLPAYSSKKILKNKIIYAINEGQNVFLLS